MRLFSVFSELAELVWQKKTITLILFALGLIGFLCGIFIPQKTVVEHYFIASGQNYIVLIFSSSCSLLRLFFRRAFFLFFFFASGLLVSLSGKLFPVHVFFLLLKSYFFGCLFSAICKEYSFHGFFVLILSAVPSELLFGVFFVARGVSCLYDRFSFSRSALTLGIPLIASALWETLIAALLFRPLNFIG